MVIIKFKEVKRAGLSMNRSEALKLLEEKVKRDSLRKHCLATEAIMRALAEELGL